MAKYPYRLVVTKNVRSALVPAIGASVSVYNSGTSVVRSVYQDTSGISSSEIIQPFKVDSNGEAVFYVEPGKIRIEVAIDPVTTRSYEEVIIDNDIISLPIMNEVPEGVIDGINKSFILTKAPVYPRMACYINGIRQKLLPSTSTPTGMQYTVLGTTLSLGTAPVPGDMLLIDYYVV